MVKVGFTLVGGCSLLVGQGMRAHDSAVPDRQTRFDGASRRLEIIRRSKHYEVDPAPQQVSHPQATTGSRWLRSMRSLKLV